MTAVRILAEFGQSCRGDVGVAIDQAQAAKDAGAWGAKWQAFHPDRIASTDAAAYWDLTMGGSQSQRQTFADNGMIHDRDWIELFAACREIGIEPIVTPFDLQAVDTLFDAGIQTWKVASGDITYAQLLRRIAETQLPVILSTGASNPREIYRALDWLAGCQEVTLLACSLAYPTRAGDANLSRIEGLAGFPVAAVGYSDHTLDVETAFGAAALGATVLERHCTLDHDGEVPDDKMALLAPAELKEYCRLAQLGAAMRGNPYPGCSTAEEPAKVGARRSLHAARYMRKGHRFAAADFVCVRPGDGAYEPADVDRLVGRKAARTIRVGTKLTVEDVA
jgi:N,N'-diacetyllegionaminate synthase